MLDPADISVADFKAQFPRGFTYVGTSTCANEEQVRDDDITRALAEANINFNPALFSDDATLRMAFLYLSAHYLCNDLQTAMQGIGSTAQMPVNSRSVGGVSESYQVPEWVSRDPFLGYYATTRYGMKYLSIIKPLLIGACAVYQGATTAE